jgi:hypothetical protein
MLPCFYLKSRKKFILSGGAAEVEGSDTREPGEDCPARGSRRNRKAQPQPCFNLSAISSAG